MLWKDGAKAAFALGFDLDGATIWRNKAERLPGGSAFIKGPSIGEYGLRVGALRVMVNLNQIGEAAGVAAYIAVNEGKKVQELDGVQVAQALAKGGSANLA